MSDERRFCVLRGQSRVPAAERDSWPESLPWSVVERWRDQAERNHSQTLEVLHGRGGLAPDELWLAAHGLGLRHIKRITESAAGQWLIQIAEQAMTPPPRTERQILTDIAAHIDASPLGWHDGKPLIHRSTTDADIVAWLQRLKHLRNELVIEVLEAGE